MTASMVVDGYNVLCADERLRSLREDDFEAARETLISDLVDYCDREECEMEVVFDAAGAGGAESHEKRSRYLDVTFTAGGKTADSYIEGFIYAVPKSGVRAVTIVTGDWELQRIASGAGLLRMSSREFLEELCQSEERWRTEPRGRGPHRRRVRLDERIPRDVRAALERFRRKQ
ncbi:MAG: NYN domain-containing protein [Actinobacteria bacterium]|nr:NYN domain-containing protein [Actinomycetota bacterium]MBU4241129.1 NYN domain-containing protein [Actinomycetota bacterium]